MAHSVTIAKISEHKRKQIELSHRILKVRQRKGGRERVRSLYIVGPILGSTDETELSVNFPPLMFAWYLSDSLTNTEGEGIEKMGGCELGCWLNGCCYLCVYMCR